MEEMEKLFENLTEENKHLMILLANAINVAQENKVERK